MIAAAKDAAKDLGMQRLDPAVHHFRKSGVLGDVARGESVLQQELSRAASAIKLHASSHQFTGQLRQPVLVANAYQRSCDRNPIHLDYPWQTKRPGLRLLSQAVKDGDGLPLDSPRKLMCGKY